MLRVDGFRVVIFLPPREHKPPHVHVRNADGETVIVLAGPGTPQTVRDVTGMRADDVAAAFWTAEEYTEYLPQRWRQYHG